MPFTMRSALRLALKVGGDAQCEDQGCDPEQGKTWDFIWFFDNYLSRHGDQGNFEDDANVDGIFSYVCLQGFWISSTPMRTRRKYPKMSSKP